MKRYSILLIIILCSLFSFSQVKQQYNQYGGLWKRLSLRWDGGFQLPRSPVSTADLYSSVIDSGQVYYDPSDSSVRYYTGFQWLTMGTGSSSRFGVSGEDESASQNRYFNLHDSYSFTLDSINNGYISFNAANGFGIADLAGNYYLRMTDGNGSQLFAPDFSNNVQVNSGNISLIVGSGDYISSTNLPYNSGTAVVPMVQDTVTGKWYRQTITGSSTQTLQHVFDTETGEALMDKDDTINVADNKFHFRSSGVNGLVRSDIYNGSQGSYFYNDISSFIAAGYTSTYSGVLQVSAGLGKIYGQNIDNGDYSEAEVSSDSISIKPNAGILNIDSLRTQYGDTTTWKPLVWSPHNKGLKKFNSWGEIGLSGGTPGGSNKQFQYNNSSAFGGTTGVEYGNSNELVKITEQNTADTILKIVGIASQTGDFSSITNSDGEKIGGMSAEGYTYMSNRYEPWYTIFDECGGTVAYGLWNKQVFGTGSALLYNNSISYPANWISATRYSVGTTTTGSGSFQLNAGGSNTAVYLDSTKRFNYGTKILLDTLSDGTNTYYIVCGIADNFVPASTARGVYFRYTNADSSGKWIACCVNASTKTEVATSVTVATNTEYELEFTAIGNKVWFYINDILVAVISTNVPTTSMACGGTITKTAGTITRYLYQDWIGVGYRKK